MFFNIRSKTHLDTQVLEESLSFSCTKYVPKSLTFLALYYKALVLNNIVFRATFTLSCRIWLQQLEGHLNMASIMCTLAILSSYVVSSM